MVSTEEQNPVKGMAGVRDLLQGVLPGLRGVTSEYALPVVQALAAQEPAVAYKHEPDDVRETVRPGPTLAANNATDKKQEALEDLTRLKHGRIAEIRGLIGMALDAGAKERLAELLERLENAMGRKDIEEALRDAATALTSIHTGGSDKDDGVDAKSIDAMHKNLYATDAEYRKVADEVTEKAAEIMERSKERRAASDEIADKYGIKTPADDALKAAQGKYDQLEDKTTFEARRLELEIIKKEQEQNEARIAALKKDGRYEEAAKLEAERGNIDNDLNKLKANYFTQHDAYLEAYKRHLDKQVSEGMPKEVADEKYKEEVARMQKNAAEILSRNSEAELKNFTADITEATTRIAQDAKSSERLVGDNAVLNAEILKSTVGKDKLPVTEASLSDSKVSNVNQMVLPQNPGIGGLG